MRFIEFFIHRRISKKSNDLFFVTRFLIQYITINVTKKIVVAKNITISIDTVAINLISYQQIFIRYVIYLIDNQVGSIIEMLINDFIYITFSFVPTPSL